MASLKMPQSLLTLLLMTVMVASAQVPECIPGKLSDYQKLGPEGCRIGDIVFSDFHRATGSNGLSSSAISVTPGTAIDSTDPALLLEGPWIGRPARSTVSISYKVSAAPPAKPVIGASLQMQFGEITGTGAATVEAVLHPSDASTAAKLQLKLGKDVARKENDEADLAAPSTEVAVGESITVEAGRDGSAKIKGFMTVFALQGVKSGSN